MAQEKDYEHCDKSADGKHQPDPRSLHPDQDAGRNRGTDWILDCNCIHCGQSGSMRVEPADFVWA